MKKTFITVLIVIQAAIVYSQIKNPGFELKSDTNANVPQYWNVIQWGGYAVSLDHHQKFENETAITIGNDSPNSNAVGQFFQEVDIKPTHLKKFIITAYIKTEYLNGSATLWCKVNDSNKKMISYQNMDLRNLDVKGTVDWKQYHFVFFADSSARQLVVGGLLYGTGHVWYDKFNLEDAPPANDPPSGDAKKYIEVFTETVKKYSIYSDMINWLALNRDIDELSKGAQTFEDAQLVTNYILSKLRALGDNHSFIMSKIRAVKYASQNTVTDKAYSKLLTNNYGYLYIPGFGSTNDTASVNFASNIQTMIRQLDIGHTIKGWIVDLRGNSGGNMRPMIAGLGPLLGNDSLGYFISKQSNGNKSDAWYYKNGAVSGAIIVKTPYVLKNPNTKIVVLIGPKTASSGEITAISFIGKPNVKLIGQPTGGLTTGNRDFKLSDGSVLLLASSYEADRNKKKYLGKIQPDILVDTKTGTDADLDAAIAWLNAI